MNEPRKEWAAPAGWGPPGPSTPPAAPPPDQPPASGAPAYGTPESGASAYGAPAYGAPAYGSAPPPYGGWGPPRPAELKPGVVPLRPLGLGELLDGAVGIVRRYPRPALGLSALVALVSTVVDILLLLTAFDPLVGLDPATVESGDTEALEGALGGLAAGSVASGVVSLLAAVVLTGVITAVVGRAVLGQPLTAGEAWGQVRPKLPRLLGLSLLVILLCGAVLFGGVAVGVGVIAAGGGLLAIVGVPLIIAGVLGSIYLYVRLALAPCALVLEGVDIRTSMRRSSVLAKGDWWRIFGILLLTAIIAGVVSFVLQLPFQFASAFGALTGDLENVSTTGLIIASIGGGIALTLTAPFSAGVQALLYVDRRMRGEGLDVALAASATGATPPAGDGTVGGT